MLCFQTSYVKCFHLEQKNRNLSLTNRFLMARSWHDQYSEFSIQGRQLIFIRLPEGKKYKNLCSPCTSTIKTSCVIAPSFVRTLLDERTFSCSSKG